MHAGLKVAHYRTFWGVRVLRRIPDHIFRQLVSGIVAALGIYMLARGLMG